ncbi:hypothetical protein NDU88_008739 [Pleurodeles waltl]|uniref:Secreted protein n=1 Tax=Pleurodeles waltl TaxID=8319 RepID=A0AAV7RT97_PLEWA|nr:hypothetical protein NDU88_008739 [Pleurodeles waltl]
MGRPTLQVGPSVIIVHTLVLHFVYCWGRSPPGLRSSRFLSAANPAVCHHVPASISVIGLRPGVRSACHPRCLCDLSGPGGSLRLHIGCQGRWPALSV